MRLPVVVLLCSAAGVLGGGALIGLWALGTCLIFCSLAAAAWALRWDDGRPARPGAHEAPTLAQVLDKSRVWSTWDDLEPSGAQRTRAS